MSASEASRMLGVDEDLITKGSEVAKAILSQWDERFLRVHRPTFKAHVTAAVARALQEERGGRNVHNKP